MILDRLALALWRGRMDRDGGAAARARARRWQEADEREPQLAGDLIVLGRVLVGQPVDGSGRLAASAEQLAYEAGRRDLAVELLAMMALTPGDLRAMMEMDDA